MSDRIENLLLAEGNIARGLELLSNTLGEAAALQVALNIVEDYVQRAASRRIRNVQLPQDPIRFDRRLSAV